MGAFLGVDGGGTKTTAVVADGSGLILARATGGPTNPEWVGASARERLAGILGPLVADSGVPAGAIQHAYLGMAGVNSDDPEDPNRLLFLDALGDIGVDRGSVTVDNDSYIGLASGVGDSPGVAVVAGTGFNTVGRGPDGSRHRVPWYVAGRGAGHILGKQAAMAAFFGKAGGPPTSLADKVMGFLGVSGTDGLLDWLSEWRGSDDFGKLTALLTEAADEGDETSIDMLRTAGMEFGLAAILVARHLGLGRNGTVCPVVTIGGVFKAGPWVKGPMQAVLDGSGTGASLVEPAMPPVGGALMLAWGKADHDAGIEAKETLIRELGPGETP